MRFLYDYQAFNQKFGGISRYYCEVIKQIQKTHRVDISCIFSENIYLKDTLGRKVSCLSKYNFRGKSFINREYSKYLLWKNQYDIIHVTGDSEYYYEGYHKCPIVLTFHDLIAEYYYKDIPFWNEKLELRKKILRNADRITCVSEFTRNTMLEYYPFINPEKTDVIYHGISPFEGEYLPNSYGRYILFVGSRAIYKNFQFTIKSLKPFLEKNDDIKVICTGAPFTNEEKSFLSDNRIMDKVLNISYVNDITLASLYHHALLFIYPSKYEGFGIPILESFINGCPVCLANATCFPEIGGDAVTYFDPDDADSILQSVEKLIEDEDYAIAMKHKGLERSRQFTWEKAAEKLQAVYAKAIDC